MEELSPESAKYTIQTDQEFLPALWVSPGTGAEREGPVPAFQTLFLLERHKKPEPQAWHAPTQTFPLSATSQWPQGPLGPSTPSSVPWP